MKGKIRCSTGPHFLGKCAWGLTGCYNPQKKGKDGGVSKNHKTLFKGVFNNKMDNSESYA